MKGTGMTRQRLRNSIHFATRRPNSISKTNSRKRLCDCVAAVEVIVKRKMTMHTVDSEELATRCSAQRLQLSPTLFLVLGGSLASSCWWALPADSFGTGSQGISLFPSGERSF